MTFTYNVKRICKALMEKNSVSWNFALYVEKSLLWKETPKLILLYSCLYTFKRNDDSLNELNLF